MPLKTTKFIWHEGRLVPWEQATVHVLSHALHYGSSVFEGIRVYKTPQRRRRLQAHGPHSAPLPLREDLPDEDSRTRAKRSSRACRDVVRENGCSRARTSGRSRFAATARWASQATSSSPRTCSIAAWEWGSYLGEGALEQGVDVCVSSWQRVAPNTVPALAKAGGNYLVERARDARGAPARLRRGYRAQHVDGYVSEGAGENLFLVQNGKLYTPPVAASILSGITRDTVASSRSRWVSRSSSRTFRASCSTSPTRCS